MIVKFKFKIWAIVRLIQQLITLYIIKTIIFDIAEISNYYLPWMTVIKILSILILHVIGLIK